LKRPSFHKGSSQKKDDFIVRGGMDVLMGRIRTAGASGDGADENIDTDDSWQLDTYDDDSRQGDADTDVEFDDEYDGGEDQSPAYVSDNVMIDDPVYSDVVNGQANGNESVIQEDQQTESGDDDYPELDEEPSIEGGQDGEAEYASVDDMISRNRLVMRPSGEEIEPSPTERSYDDHSKGWGIIGDGNRNRDRLVMRTNADAVDVYHEDHVSHNQPVSGVVEETPGSSFSKVQGADGSGIEQMSDVERSLQEWLAHKTGESKTAGSIEDHPGDVQSDDSSEVVGEKDQQDCSGSNASEGVEEGAPIENSSLGGVRTVSPFVGRRDPRGQSGPQSGGETMSVPTASIPSVAEVNKGLYGQGEIVQQGVGGVGRGGLETGLSYAQNSDEASQGKGGKRGGKASKTRGDVKDCREKSEMSEGPISGSTPAGRNDTRPSAGVYRYSQADSLGAQYGKDDESGARSPDRKWGGVDVPESALAGTAIGEGQRPGRFNRVGTDIEAQSEETQRGVIVIENAVTKLVERMENLDVAISQLGQQNESREDMHALVRMLSDDLRSVTERLDEMEKQVSIMARKSSDTMGYAMRGKFHCKSCGEHGYVVSTIRCSRCGDESWWGWWPEEDGQ